MNVDIAANRVAERFVKNTNIKQFDPMWIVALVQIIIYVIKYCQEKKDLNSFKGAVKSGLSPLGKYFGLGRRVRVALKKAIVTHLIQANCDEVIRAMLESASEAKDDEILDLIKAVDQVDFTP